MKLVALMSIEEYSKELKRLLVSHRIPVFSEMDILGFKTNGDHSVEENWFSAGGEYHIYSALFFVFVDEGKAEELFKAVDEHNHAHEGTDNHPFRAFQLNVEKSI